MIPSLFLLPFLAGIAVFSIREDSWRRRILIGVAVFHLLLTALCWVKLPNAWFMGWFALDSAGLLFLSITSLLFLTTSFYSVGYFQREGSGKRVDFEENFLFVDAPEARFTGCLLFFLATMTLVILSQHFGMFWVAMEATTLASAPLIYFHRHHRSLEATWKYLMICSVGIALALLGNFFLAVAATPNGEEPISLLVNPLLAAGGKLQTSWLKAAFIFFLVGYGTKMGLAPMHTWLPDAHSESPSVVSSLLSGALLNCAFLGILRAYQVCAAAGIASFVQELLVDFGLLSLAVAAIFIIGQRDYKRMLAYSSIEHMGILALGVGLGGVGIFGAMLHAINHSLTKGMLFLVAGNILSTFHTKSTSEVRGVLRVIPCSGILWLVGFLAITGTPPFGLFLSELTILKAALDQKHIFIAIVYLVLLSFIFIGMASVFLPTAQGKTLSSNSPIAQREGWLAILPPLCLGILILMLGVYIPSPINQLLHEAARMLGGA